METININEAVIGKYCVVRCDRAGVFAGTVKAVNGQTALMKDVRRIHYWSGAASLSQVATEGVKNPRSCRFTVTVDTLLLTDVIEIMPTTEAAKTNILGVPVWKM